MDNLNVIHTINTLWKSSGVTHAVVESANYSASLGHKVVIITWKKPNSFEKSSLSPNTTLISLEKNKFFLYNFIVFYRVLLKYINYNQHNNRKFIIHDHGLWLESNIAAGLIAYFKKIPVIVSTHGMLEPWALKHQIIKKKIAWYIYQKWLLIIPKMIHVTAQSEKQSIQNLLPKKNIRIIPLGVKKIVTPSTCQNKTAIFLSRIHIVKGLEILIDAWIEMDQDWQLIIAGPSDALYLETLKQKIKHLGLTNRITFIGPIYDEEKINLLTKASLFILPSYSENFGIVIAEAMMAGLPIITTNTTPWLEVINRNCGWIISPDVDELKNTLRIVSQLDHNELRRMGQIGRAWMFESYTWEIYGSNINKVYQKLLHST